VSVWLFPFSVGAYNPAGHEVWFYRRSCCWLSKQYKS